MLLILVTSTLPVVLLGLKKILSILITFMNKKKIKYPAGLLVMQVLFLK